MRSLKVLSHPRFETPTESGMTVKDTSHDLNFCVPYQKNRRVPVKVIKRKTATY